jgi:uncharacterized protein YdaU (DUF1376 family)
MEWYPHHISDYDADTIHLTAFEDGCYSRLLRWYYLNERPLPSDDRTLAIICRISIEEWRTVSDTLLAFFVTRDKRVSNGSQTATPATVLIHRRCDLVITNQNKRRKDGKARQEKRRKYTVLEDVTRDIAVTNASVTLPEERRGEEKKKEETALPSWIPIQDWKDYLEFRRKKARSGMTERAKQLAINELETLRKAGNDPAKVLQQSILRGWTGLFEVKARSGQLPLQPKKPTAITLVAGASHEQ